LGIKVKRITGNFWRGLIWIAIVSFPSFGLAQVPLQLGIYQSTQIGTLDLSRYSLGNGGLSSAPMFRDQIPLLQAIRPKTIRIFIQEYYDIYPDHGVYNWSQLDETLNDIKATGARPIANIDFKPKVLFPVIEQSKTDPNNYSEWEELVYQLVKHANDNGYGIRYWEIGNEGDIGESGGCPYLFSSDGYVRYYTHTANAILRADPNAKIGGPALAGFASSIGDAIMAAAASGSTRLDFFSWHMYTNSPDSILASINNVKGRLAYYGLKNTETLISEWNVGLSNPILDSRFQPVFIFQVTKAFHDSGLSMAAYYHVRDYHVNTDDFLPFMSASGAQAMADWWNVHPQYDGIFDFNERMRPAYHALRWTSSVLNGPQLQVSGTNNDVSAYSVTRGNSIYTAIWNYSNAGISYDVEIGLPQTASGNFQLAYLNAATDSIDILRQGTIADLASNPLRVTINNRDVYFVQVDNAVAGAGTTTTGN
jgi:xylan 1,4-beta-xylosidase